MKFILFISITIMFNSCNKKSELVEAEQAAQNKVERQNIRSFNEEDKGKELFKSLYFLKGDVTKNITALRGTKEYYDEVISSLTQKQKEDLLIAQDKIIDRMHIADSSFFKIFYNDISSNNPLRVRTAIIEASELFINSVTMDKEFLPLLLQSQDLIEGIDVQQILNIDGTINILKLNEEVQRLGGTGSNFTNANNTLANFGMSGGSPNTVVCATVVAIGVAVVTWGVGVNYAAAVNAAAAVNIVAAINVYVIVNNPGDNSGGSSGGSSTGGSGGKGCKSLRMPNPAEIEAYNLQINNGSSFELRPPKCPNEGTLNTPYDNFIQETTSVFAR